MNSSYLYNCSLLQLKVAESQHWKNILTCGLWATGYCIKVWHKWVVCFPKEITKLFIITNFSPHLSIKYAHDRWDMDLIYIYTKHSSLWNLAHFSHNLDGTCKRSMRWGCMINPISFSTVVSLKMNDLDENRSIKNLHHNMHNAPQAAP
jgi:hypothetical protein